VGELGRAPAGGDPRTSLVAGSEDGG
jgi:hypothetical protein